MSKCPYYDHELDYTMKACPKLQGKSDIDDENLKDSSGEVTCEVNLICEECIQGR